MSSKPAKKAPEAEKPAAAATETAATPPATKPKIVKGDKPNMDEAIEIALAAASTAVDSAQEIQRLRAEVQTQIKGARRNNAILFWTTVLILLVAGVGIFGSLVFYKRAYNEYDATAKVSREALVVFAGEINALVAASKAIDEALKVSHHSVENAASGQEDVKKALQALSAGNKELATKIPASNAYDKQFAALQKSIDELANASRIMATRIGELQVKQINAAPPPAAPAPRVQAKPAPIVAQRPRPAARASADPLIRYP